MLSNLNRILCKGIHESNDDNKAVHYQYLLAMIVMQLEHVKEQNDKEMKSNEINKYLNDIVSKIK